MQKNEDSANVVNGTYYFRSEKPVSANVSDISNEQNSNQGSPLKEIEELSVLKSYQPLYQPDFEWAQPGRSSGEPNEEPTQAVQQPHDETMTAGSFGATNSHNEDGRGRSQ